MSKEIRELKQLIESLETELLKVEDLDYELNDVFAMLDYLQALRDDLKDLQC